MSETPYGYCQCGCGVKTSIATRNSTKYSIIKGEPRLFKQGHGGRLNPIAVFLKNIDRTKDCWEWQAYRNPDGYGMIGVYKKMPLAHRYSWELHNGKIPDGLCVLHKCDNPPCCNPDHLFLGTVLDNNRDCASKGRKAVSDGEACGKAKLTNEKVLEIRDMASSMSRADIGRMYGVAATAISKIISRKRWKHI